MKQYTRFIILLATLTILSACSTSNKTISESNPENFDTFYDRFHSDESFQLERISFPIKGSSEDINGKTSWTRKNWIPLKVKIYDIDTKTYKVDYKKTTTGFSQKFWLLGSGFLSEYRFERKMGKWFLVYAYDGNL